MEMVINMLMLVRAAGEREQLQVFPWQSDCIFVYGREGERIERRHTHTPQRVNRGKAACKRATFPFQSASGDSAKGLLLAHWWDKKWGQGGGEGEGQTLHRLAKQAFFPFFFPPYRTEAPLSMRTHLPCRVIVAQNGTHLIQAAQDPFCLFKTKQVMF